MPTPRVSWGGTYTVYSVILTLVRLLNTNYASIKAHAKADGTKCRVPHVKDSIPFSREPGFTAFSSFRVCFALTSRAHALKNSACRLTRSLISSQPKMYGSEQLHQVKHSCAND